MADSEARIEALRKRAGLSATVAAGNKKRKRGAEDDAEQALNQQLQPKGWASSSKQQPESESRATIVRPEQQSPSADESHELNGHINFWADYENGVRFTPSCHRLP